MTTPSEAIEAAYDRIVAELDKTRQAYLIDARENASDFEGITEDDAYTWFIESL